MDSNLFTDNNAPRWNKPKLSENQQVLNSGCTRDRPTDGRTN